MKYVGNYGNYCKKEVNWDIDKATGEQINIQLGNPDILNKDNSCKYFKKRFSSKKQKEFFCINCQHFGNFYADIY